MLMGALVTASVLAQSVAPSLKADWGIVLPADYWPSNQYGWCSREAPGRGGYWTPDSETIRELEVALAPALQLALAQEIKDPSRRPAADEYYRQYVGIRIRDRRMVYINGFHKRYLDVVGATKKELNWRTRVIDVCDGGSSYFGAEYDPVTQQVTNIRFNGPG